MNYQAVELSVCVGDKPLHVYKDLEDDSFVEARKGSEYILRLRNKTLERVLAVVSVDGLSIMNGEQATPDSGGYILAPMRPWRSQAGSSETNPSPNLSSWARPSPTLPRAISRIPPT